eukprot:2348091-Prymnesium_polylepis.1
MADRAGGEVGSGKGRRHRRISGMMPIRRAPTCRMAWAGRTPAKKWRGSSWPSTPQLQRSR